MTNRTGRTIRRALAVMLGLGGLGIYATAQQPKPLVIKSTGAPGVYTVDGPTPGNMLPPSVMPGVPVQPAVASAPMPVAPIATNPNMLPGVPLPPADTAVARENMPVAPVAAKSTLLPGVPLPPVETAVARDNMPQMPLAPLPPKAPTTVTPVEFAAADAPLAPIAPTIPSPQSTPTPTQSAPVTVTPTASVTPITPTTPATRVQQAPVMIIQPTRKPRVVVEQASAPLTPETPNAPTTPTPPVLLAPVLGPSGSVPRPAGTPSVLPQGTVTQAPIIVPQPAPVATTTITQTPAQTGEQCEKCGRLRSHGGCCVCARATVPPPVGASVRAAFGTQRANALEEYCVIFREDFDMDADTLNPTGERHISGIARRFDQTHAAVKIEPTGNAALDRRRAAVVVSALVKAGIPVEAAANRVQGGTSRAEGMSAPDIEPTNVRYGVASYGYGYTAAPTYGAFATFGPFLPYR
ncbi:MAG: hypothetical protein K8U57_36530 [Planctomycetes bacterium]|nr:hypothetical protein [Planctomycetota bacterium]